MATEPIVTGVSPKEGPPGTSIIVRGENLGKSEDDVCKLTIAGSDCLPYLIWESPKKINIRCMVIGTGPILIETKSGGKGSCSVEFTCHEQNVGLTDESAVWIDEFESLSLNENEINIPGVEKEYSMNLTSPSFMPQLYVRNNYSNASISELEEELATLKSVKAARNDQSVVSSDMQGTSLLKTNLVVVMECLQILETLCKNIAISRDHSVDIIERSVTDCLERTHNLFDPLLAQKDLVQSIENAMHIFKQNEVLFNLPSEIDKSIESNQFDVVVKNVAEVKSKSGANKQGLSDKIWTDVDSQIERLKSHLERKLLESCQNISGDHNIDEIKKLIGYLMKIESDSKTLSDHVWNSMVNMSQSLIASLNDTHESCLKMSLGLTKSHNLKQQPSHESDHNEEPYVVQFVQRAINIFNNNYYDLYQLGQSYFDPKDEFCSNAPSDEFKAKMAEYERTMISNPIEHLGMLLRIALVPNAKNQSPWPSYENPSFIRCLQDVMQSVIACHVRLTKTNLPIAAKAAVEDFRSFVFDLRRRSMEVLLNHAARENSSLHKNEDWIIEVNDIHGGRTNLPNLFERNVLDTLRFANEAIFQTSLPDEKSILKRIEIQAKMKELVQKLINSFLDTLDNALTDNKEYPISLNQSLLACRNSNRSLQEYDKLLITICNCQYTKEQILLKLKEEFEKLQDLKLDKVFEICCEKYSDFIRRNSEKFCKMRSRQLIKSIKEAKKVKEKQHIGNSKSELRMELIVVNAQIFLIAPQLVESLMTSIIDLVKKEIL